ASNRSAASDAEILAPSTARALRARPSAAAQAKTRNSRQRRARAPPAQREPFVGVADVRKREDNTPSILGAPRQPTPTASFISAWGTAPGTVPGFWSEANGLPHISVANVMPQSRNQVMVHLVFSRPTLTTGGVSPTRDLFGTK